MISVPAAEISAIKQTIEYAKLFGYGNLIAHLKTAWAQHLVRQGYFVDDAFRVATGSPYYPFKLQEDILTLGAWDETGKRYQEEEVDEKVACSPDAADSK